MILAFNNKQGELAEEGKATRSLLCIPRIANRVPSTPENCFFFILELPYWWQAFRFNKKRCMSLLQEKVQIRDVKSKGTWLTCFVCLLIALSPSSWLLMKEETDIHKQYYTDQEDTVSWVGFPFRYISICRSILSVQGKLSFPQIHNSS